MLNVTECLTHHHDAVSVECVSMTRLFVLNLRYDEGICVESHI